MKNLVFVLESNFEILENRDNVAEKLPCKGECTNTSGADLISGAEIVPLIK